MNVPEWPTSTPPRWEITALADTSVRLDILGPIGETWDESGVTAAEIVAALGELSPSTRVDLHLSSPGGSAPEGVVIYNNLRRFGNVRVVVDGMAASAASIIAMAGREIVMSPGSLMMVHNGRGALFGGTVEEFRTMADLLEKTNTSMAEIYQRQAGGTVAGWLEAMHREQWYTASEAVDAGLATTVDDDAPEVDSAEVTALAEWGRAVFGHRHAGRADAGEPLSTFDVAALAVARAAADTATADAFVTGQGTGRPDGIRQPDTDPLAALALLVPPDPLAALAALATGKDGTHADS